MQAGKVLAPERVQVLDLAQGRAPERALAKAPELDPVPAQATLRRPPHHLPHNPQQVRGLPQ